MSSKRSAKMNQKSVKDRLKDETLDLSLCDLQEVPVREIAAVRKATHLDLSNNLLVSLPITFATLKQIVKLDLSKNMLTEIPENFGEMKQLKHLDLYANQISRLPLSLSELKNLRWLDLKENPLTPAVASVAGPCSNLSECQACARNIVAYLSRVKVTIDEEKLRRQTANAANVDTDAASKKEGKKKKKKTAEKENKKNLDKNGSKLSKVSDTNASDKGAKSVSSQKSSNKKSASKGNSNRGLYWSFISAVTSALLLCFAFMMIIAFLPLYSKEQSEIVLNYVETQTGVSLKPFQQQSIEILNNSTELVTKWANDIYETLNDTYEKHFGANANIPENK